MSMMGDSTPRIEGATDGTLIGNEGDKLKTTAYITGDQDITINAEMSSNYYPDPKNYNTGVREPIQQDPDSSLYTTAACITDAGSFADCFEGTDNYQTLTGTVSFENGSTTVTGEGTLFTEELQYGSFIKISTHDQEYWTSVATVISDTEVELDAPYGGATATGTGYATNWAYYENNGATKTQADSECILESGTTNGAYAFIRRLADYSPMLTHIIAKIDYRRENQTTIIGFCNDGATAPGEVVALAVFEFTGTNKHSCTCKTSGEGTYYDYTTIVLPDFATTDVDNEYKILVHPDQVSFYINDIIVAKHNKHIPLMYSSGYMQVCAYIENTAANSTTKLEIDRIFLKNYDILDVQVTDSNGLHSTTTNGLKEHTYQGVSDGFASLTSTNLVWLQNTTYTEQSANSQMSIKSSSTSDASAGTGARTVKVTYFNASCIGPFTTEATMNGTTAVNFAETDMCFIEKIEVTSAGSNGSPVGTITLYASTGGTGTAVWSLAVGENRTHSAHHYVADGLTCYITSFCGGNNGGSAGKGGWMRLQEKKIGVTDSVNITITERLFVPGGVPPFQRNLDSPIIVDGPARITGYVAPESSNAYYQTLSFSWYED